jgi:ubiquinone/menaquinone biosynthesis C-methylase UbiE
VSNSPSRHSVVHGVCVVIIAGSCVIASAPKAQAPPADSRPRYETRQQHSPDGIGKFYRGREIAQVMGHEGADWLERSTRDAEEHPRQLLEELNLRPGMVVADIGSGTGFFSFPMAKKVGGQGKVLAVDIQPEMIAFLTQRSRALGLTNVIPVLGTATDAQLSPESVDLVLMVDVYHEFSFPHEMMQSICQACKPAGKVVFVEYRAEDPSVPIKPLHKMTEAQVRKEMEDTALKWVETKTVLPWQHIIVFEKPR